MTGDCFWPHAPETVGVDFKVCDVTNLGESVVLIVNQPDLPDKQGIIPQAREFAKSKRMKCFPGSTRMGENVKEALVEMAQSIYAFYVSPGTGISCFVVGDRRVGKRKLVSQLFREEFDDVYEPSQGEILRYGLRIVGDRRVRVALVSFPRAFRVNLRESRKRESKARPHRSPSEQAAFSKGGKDARIEQQKRRPSRTAVS
jgi:hypothetical protein